MWEHRADAASVNLVGPQRRFGRNGLKTYKENYFISDNLAAIINKNAIPEKFPWYLRVTHIIVFDLKGEKLRGTVFLIWNEENVLKP